MKYENNTLYFSNVGSHLYSIQFQHNPSTKKLIVYTYYTNWIDLDNI